MTLDFTDLIQFMKQSIVDQSNMWADYEYKLNPYATNAAYAE